MRCHAFEVFDIFALLNKVFNGDGNDKYWFALKLALICKIVVHWLASYKPNECLVTPHTFTKLKPTPYTVLYTELYTVLYNKLYPDVQVAG